jgi:glycosyltransferase involved in cell wall biosynthesis
MTDYLVPDAERPASPGPSPSFSVVIPAYQAAATIADAVGSALSQTSPPHEVIVCDDGSTDALHDALAPFRDRIGFLQKENGGGASALNAAVEAASGEFAVILDSDDAYLPERLSELGRLVAMRPDLDVVSTDAFFEVDGRVTGRFNRANPFPVVAQREALLRSCYLFAPAVRRTRLLAVGGFDESLRIAYDWDCWIRLVLSGSAVGLVDEPLTRYRLREGSLSANRIAALEERVIVLEKVRNGVLPLTGSERRALKDSISFHRARMRHGRAQAALLSHDRTSRRRSLEAAFTAGSPARARVKALAAAVAPGLAARRLAKGSEDATTNLLARPTGDG